MHDSDEPISSPPGADTALPSPVTNWSVDASQAGCRLDRVLAQALSLSRQQVKTLLDQQAVKLNGKPVGPNRKGLILHEGSELAVAMPASDMPGRWKVTPEPGKPVTILAQGPGWVMLDKPAGMPVHPLAPDETGTLLNAAIARWPAMQGVGEAGMRSGVVHRLDVETSGVVVLATNDQTWWAMRAAFAEHRTRKFYTAIVAGHLPDQGQLTLNLTIAQHRPAKVKVVEAVSAQSRACDLAWRVIRRAKQATLVHVELGTGFLHQIRVMLAHLGHPVLGDRVYGEPDGLANTLLPSDSRLMLHAHHLELLDQQADSPIPQAMMDSWQALSKDEP